MEDEDREMVCQNLAGGQQVQVTDEATVANIEAAIRWEQAQAARIERQIARRNRIVLVAWAIVALFLLAMIIHGGPLW